MFCFAGVTKIGKKEKKKEQRAINCLGHVFILGSQVRKGATLETSWSLHPNWQEDGLLSSL